MIMDNTFFRFQIYQHFQVFFINIVDSKSVGADVSFKNCEFLLQSPMLHE